MSISVYGLIKEKKLDMDLFKEKINSFYCAVDKTKLDINGKKVCFEGEEYSFDIIYIEKEEYPYNVWDSEILNGEYEFSQTIMFDLYKDIDYMKAYKNIIDFFVFLNKELSAEILVTSDAHNDICYIDKDILWSERWENI